MTDLRMPIPLRRWLAGVLAILIGLGPIATPAYAAFSFTAQGVTLLGDEPLNTRNSAKPNIVFTADDSTSMLFDFLPDYVASQFCRGGLGAMTAACASTGAANDFTAVGGGKYFSPGYTYQQYSDPYPNYVPGYDASGPGAGCFPGSPPTCSAGIDPGPLPGVAQYPAGPQLTWPNSFQPYEYWLLWPAPAHSAALNTLYYDPRIVYDPPVDSTGASYPQMDDAGTSTWTKVPSDPWASSVTYVDLTAKITIGQWCNSDWSMGLVPTDPTDPNYGKYCRANGSGAGAFGTVSASQGKDYTYPWAPPSFTLSPSAGSTTTKSYAAEKVTLDGTLTGTAINAGVWNATSQNQKYFYENENIIWCDVTSPSWPQTGPTRGQTCGNYTNQSCSAIAQVCVKPTGTCNGNQTGKCNGAFVGTCNGTSPAACNGTAAVCNNVPTCNSPGCGNLRPQTCNGVTQTCPTNPQTCSGPLGQVCNLPGTQTCQPPTCSITYSPPGCNLLPPDPENPCVPTTTCGPPTCTPDPGTCSITKSSCTSNANCPAQPGACSLTGKACMGPADCPATGNCSILGNTCQSVSDCAIVGGTCSIKGNACTTNADCKNAGTCGGTGQTAGTVCLVPSDCYYCSTGAQQACPSGLNTACTPGSCSQRVCPDGVTPCTTNANCAGIGNGTCQAAASCFASNTCPIKNGTCAQGGNGCTSSAQCSATPGTCSKQSGQPWSQKPCTSDSQCLTVGLCNNGTTACTADAQCPNIAGTCQKNPLVPCFTNNDCSGNGTCANTNAACNSNVPCANIPGNCSITNVACNTIGAAPQNDPICPAIGKCSITGARCDFNGGNSECPDQPGPLPPSAAVCSTGGVGGNAATTLRNDAENNGVVCRRNNHTGGGYTSGAYDFPSGKFLTPITNGTGADACPATDHYVSVVRHYWKAEAQWCDKKIATAGDQWLGFGTDVGGTCQPGKDSSHIYPRFFQFGSPVYVDNYSTAAFQRVDLDIAKRATATYTHTWVDSNGQTQTITRNFDNEMTNYANWFAYYRTRIQALKTVTALTFNVLDNQYRVGFHTLSNGATVAKFVDVQDFDSVQKAKWFGELFNVTIPLKIETPTLDAMQRIGDYFSPGGSAALTGATDPIILSCQKNWHMLFTDGFTNQAVPSTSVGNQDDTIPTLPIGGTPITVTGLTPGQPWPHPYREDPTAGASNAASDHAMNFWATDLRPSGPEATDNVPATNKDPATWQHLNFAALSLGTQGKLPIANQSLTENLLASGSVQWPQPYPTVNRPDNSGVDDLWHAAVNGRGRFVNAQTAAELKLGMGQILQDITNQAGSRAGVGLASSSISPTNNAVYRVTFQPGWGGTVDKFNVDPVTGVQAAVPIWQAHVQLGTALKIVNPGDTPWFTNRNVFTIDDTGKAVPFLFGNLSAAQQDSLAPGQPAVASSVLEFLRGNPTNEGVSLGQFRVRATDSFGENFLGDIIDSRAVYVGPPAWPYLDANDPGYSNFVANNSSRLAMIYAGANEGMLHAFKDTTGDEAWAFVPHDLYRPDNTGLGALAYQDGALPPFRHHYYVDSTPRIVDVNFGGSSTDWHTLLVGGLGKGGKSYYAVDVTDPSAVTDEANAAKQYLWTWTNADMGYTYGQGFVAKTRAFCQSGPGNCPTGGDWVVVVPVGYDNPSGLGKIFFIRASDGTLLKTMSTGFGSSANPSGLAQINGYTQDFHNQLVDQIYGGDLYGNFWRFNVMDPDPANWTVDKLAELTDPGGNPQPITTPPKMEVDILNGVDRWVFIGTGRLLDPTDLTNSLIADQQQTFYAIRDGTTTTPTVVSTPLQPRTDFVLLSDRVNGLTAKPDKGWYDDLPNGERIVAPVQAALSLVAYAGTSPQDNPCLTGQPATLYVRTFSLGESLLFDSSGGVRLDGIAESEGAVGLDITIFTSGSGGNTAGGIDVRIAVTAGTTGNVFFQQIVPPPQLAAHRMSWRLLGQ